MSEKTIIKEKIHFNLERRGCKRIKSGPAPKKTVPLGKTPRLSKLMALALRFDDLIQKGGIRSQTDLAQLGYVSRARVTQIMNLLLLAPDIQEQILFLPKITSGDDPYPECKIRPIVRESDWQKQRQLWLTFYNSCQSNSSSGI